MEALQRNRYAATNQDIRYIQALERTKKVCRAGYLYDETDAAAVVFNLRW